MAQQRLQPAKGERPPLQRPGVLAIVRSTSEESPNAVDPLG